MNKQPKIQERTKQNLTQAFWSFYKEKPIDKITIKEITTRAGYNRSTFYLYYNDIYEIREQLENHVLKELSERLNKLPSNLKIESDMLESITSLYIENGEYLYHLLNSDPAFVHRFKDALREYRHHFISDQSDWKGACFLEFSLSTIISAFSYWYENHKDIVLEEYILLLRKYLYRGTQE